MNTLQSELTRLRLVKHKLHPRQSKLVLERCINCYRELPEDVDIPYCPECQEELGRDLLDIEKVL